LKKVKVKVKVKVTLRLTVSQSVSLGIEPHLGPMTSYLFLSDSHVLISVGLSDERTGLSFVFAAGPCQRSLSRVLVPWDLRPYLTVLDLRLPFSSPPTTRRVTVEVFDPASTAHSSRYIAAARTAQKTVSLLLRFGVFTAILHSNGRGTDSIKNSLCIMYPCLQFHCLETECITPFFCCVT
jgi:hypothetical protein